MNQPEYEPVSYRADVASDDGPYTVVPRPAPDLPGKRTSSVSSEELRPSPLTALRRRWGVGALLSLLGLLVGLAAAATRPVQYTAEARLVVGQLDVSSQAVPGFALATQQLATTYARLIVADTIRADIANTLGSSRGQLLDYRASPIPESAIIRVEAVATDAGVASRVANAAATALRSTVAGLLLADPGAGLLREYAASRTRLGEAEDALRRAKLAFSQARSEQDRQATAVQQQAAQSSLDTIRLESDALGTRYQQTVNSAPGAPLQNVSKAVITGEDGVKTQELFGLAGLIAGLLMALLFTTWLSTIEHRRGASHRAPA